MEILISVPALRLEYSHFKMTGLRGPGSDDELIVRSPLQSGYAHVVCHLGLFEPADLRDWTTTTVGPVDVVDLRLQTWEGAPEWPVPLEPGRYTLVTAVRPAVVPPERELLSLTQTRAVVEHRLYFTASPL